MHSTGQNILCTLPTELICAILNEFDIPMLLLCREVCRLFREIIESSAELQYKIELFAAGMENASHNEITSATRLEMLQKHQDAWKHLAWAEETSMPLLSDSDVWELFGGVLAQGMGKRGLMLRQLPSRYRGVEEKEWSIEDVGFRIRDFTMDVGQNLLVALEVYHPSPSETDDPTVCRIHLLCLDNGNPHPSACHSATLSHAPDDLSEEWWFNIQISGPYVGIIFFAPLELTSECQLLIWDWQTGDMKMKLFGSSLESFVFLTDNLIMVGTLQHRPPQLEIFDFKATLVHDLDNDEGCICSFSFPPLAATAYPVSLSIRADPSPSWTPPTSNAPFHIARNDRVLVITYSSVKSLGFASVTATTLFIPLSTVLHHINQLEKSDAQNNFPWQEWGPRGTRMIPDSPSDVWVCYVYGMKYVQTHLRGSTHGRREIRVYDFNQRSIVRHLSRGHEDGHEDDGCTELLTGPTIVEKNRIMFEDNVHTWLPCRVTTMPLSRQLDGGARVEAMMLSEDSIITVTDTKKIGILTF